MKLHRRFARPSAVKLTNFIKRPHPEKNSNIILKTVIDIVTHCDFCQRLAPKSLVFHISLLNESVFNHEIIFDLVWIEPRSHPPALHIVDRGILFPAA